MKFKLECPKCGRIERIGKASINAYKHCLACGHEFTEADREKARKEQGK